MLPHLPFFVSVVFAFTTFATLFLFYRAIRNAPTANTRQLANPVLIGLSVWLLLQTIITLMGVYQTQSIPPNIVLFGILPNLLLIGSLMATKAGRSFVDSLPLRHLTWLNVVRIPVELVLYGLSLYKTVPELMTFEGRNYDILSGLTAPLIVYLCFRKGQTNRRLLLIWNLLCLGLLLTIVGIALLSAKTPFQQLAFDQPNIAITYFPFSWLPTFVVPVVLFGHLVSIRQLSR